jgi:protein-disulfide isomerase
MRSRSLLFLVLVTSGLVLGWLLPRPTADAEPGRTSATGEDSAPVARVGTALVTYSDVEAASPTEFLQLARQRHQLVEQALGRAVQTKLVEVEAEQRGISPVELVELEVDRQLDEPTDEAVEAFFRERGIPGSLSSVAPQIRDHLAEQARNERYRTFLAGLVERHPVEALLEPFRSNVASEGYPARGPEDAPVTIVEFADFQCPYCRQIVPNLEQVLATYGDQVRLVYRHYPLTGIHPDAQKSAEAAMCAHEQGRFWDLHDLMFADQEGLDVSSLKRKAGSLGLDRERFDRCLDTGQFADVVESDRETAVALGLTGTPGIFVNGRFFDGLQSAEALAAVVVDELKRTGHDAEVRPIEQRRVEVATEGFPSKGRANAPVTIVEFSDFECPSCRRLLPVLEQVQEAYGDHVRFVYRHFPLSNVHPTAHKAAEASMCADEQGRFWEMHDAMFADQGALAVTDLKATARSLGLDGTVFDECLDSGRQEGRVLADLEAGRSVGVRGTPTLLINGRMGTGVQRFETLARIIDEELESEGER